MLCIILKIACIRHGKTRSNEEKRYLSVTEESLCRAGIQQLTDYLKEKQYPKPQVVYTSPMQRCIQTVEILYPNREYIVLPALTERNFGRWEGRQYEELKDNLDYRAWIAAGGSYEIEGVEDEEHFNKRCMAGFMQLIEEAVLKSDTSIALICHGGNIMSIMEQLTHGECGIYTWQIENGTGYLFDFDTATGEIDKIWPL